MPMPRPISCVTVFDLDGTLTWHDSFLRFIVGYLRLNPLRLLRVWRAPTALLRYFFGGFDRGLLKQSVIQIFMRGDPRAKIDSWAREFAARIVKYGCRPAGLRALEAHREAGDFLVLLSASPSLYVPRIADLLRVHRVICTDVAFDGDILRGELTTPNRRGEEKSRCLAQLRAQFPGATFTAYGNSASDLPHMRIADRAVLVNAAASARHRAKRLNISTADWS
jgi:phosphatidylglycerophosphatase C